MSTLTIAVVQSSVGGFWAASVIGDSAIRSDLSHFHPGASQQEAILRGTLTALAHCPVTEPVQVRSSLAYLIDGMNRYIETWQSRGWRTSSGAPVRYQELWGELTEQEHRLDVEWLRVTDQDAEIRRLTAINWRMLRTQAHAERQAHSGIETQVRRFERQTLT